MMILLWKHDIGDTGNMTSVRGFFSQRRETMLLLQYFIKN